MKNKLLLFGMVLTLVGLIMIQFSLKNPQSPASVPEDANLINAEDDPAMQAAYDKARDSLDYFLGIVEKEPEGTQGYSLKVGVQDGDDVEFFWVYPFTHDQELFAGRINDTPEIIDSVFRGQIVEFERGQIVDWTFDDTLTKTMMGNYTGCVMLQRQAPENAAQFMELYGLDCDK